MNRRVSWKLSDEEILLKAVYYIRSDDPHATLALAKQEVSKLPEELKLAIKELAQILDL